MSATATPSVIADEADVENVASDQGGSPADDKVLADDAPGKDEEAASQDGAEPESGEAREGDGKGPGAGLSEEDRAELAELRAFREEVRSEAIRNPAFREQLMGGGGNGQAKAPDWYANVEATLRGEGGLERGAADVVLKAFSPVLARIQYLERELGGTREAVGRIGQSVGDSTGERVLEEAGVSRETQKSPQFQKHLRTLRHDPEFQRTEAQSKRLAMRLAASEWTATNARRSTAKDDRVRLQTAKSGRGGNQPSRGAAGSVQTVKVKRDDFLAAFKARTDAERRGLPAPRIVYEGDEET